MGETQIKQERPRTGRKLVIHTLVPRTMMTSQNGTEAAAMTMEIAKNIVTSRGELTLLTRLIVRWDYSTRHHPVIITPSRSHGKTGHHETSRGAAEHQSKQQTWKNMIDVVVLTLRHGYQAKNSATRDACACLPRAHTHVLTHAYFRSKHM